MLPVTSEERPPRRAWLGGTSSSRTYVRGNPAINGHLPSLRVATHRGNRMESHTNFYGNGQDSICKGELITVNCWVQFSTYFILKRGPPVGLLPYQNTLQATKFAKIYVYEISTFALIFHWKNKSRIKTILKSQVH